MILLAAKGHQSRWSHMFDFAHAFMLSALPESTILILLALGWYSTRSMIACDPVSPPGLKPGIFCMQDKCVLNNIKKKY